MKNPRVAQLVERSAYGVEKAAGSTPVTGSQRCSVCKKLKSLTDFHWRYPGVKRHCHCKSCQQQRSNKNYESRKETRKKEIKAWRKQRRRQYEVLVQDAKDKPCADCGKVYPYWVMQFDRIKPGKVDDVSSMVGQVRSLPLLLTEMQKCEVVCANCHANRTHLRRLKP
jgi:hypothetical protein